MSTHLPRANDPCPHCGRPMERPVLERLSNPFCTLCLTERRQAAILLFKPTQDQREPADDLSLYG